MNHEYSNLLNSYGELTQALHALRDMPRRAQVRQLLPLVDCLAKLDFPIADLASVLTDAGVSFTAATLRAKLYYWRKKQLLDPSAQSPVALTAEVKPHPHVLESQSSALKQSSRDQAFTNSPSPVNPPNAVLVQPLAKGVSAEPPNQRPPLTKADIKEIRDRHIDLDALVRESKKRRVQEQS